MNAMILSKQLIKDNVVMGPKEFIIESLKAEEDFVKDPEFLNFFVDLIDKEYTFAVPDSKLVDLGIIEKCNSVTMEKKLLELGLSDGTEFEKVKKTYMLTPEAFKKCLVRSNAVSDTGINYGESYMTLETLYKMYTFYERGYCKNLIKLKDEQIAQLKQHLYSIKEILLRDDQNDIKPAKSNEEEDEEEAKLPAKAESDNEEEEKPPAKAESDNEEEEKPPAKAKKVKKSKKVEVDPDIECSIEIKALPYEGKDYDPTKDKYNAATMIIANGVHTVQIITGIESAVIETMKKNISENNHTPLIMPYRSENGIDLSSKHFVAYRNNCIIAINDARKKEVSEFNENLKADILAHNKASGKADKRTLSKEKQKFVKLLVKDFLVKTTNDSIEYKENPVCTFDNIVEFVVEHNNIPEEALYKK